MATTVHGDLMRPGHASQGVGARLWEIDVLRTFAIGLMVVSCAVLYWQFRRAGWL
jgi:hypothetical protein